MTKMIKGICVVAAALSLTACDMFKRDNYPGPNASFNGRIIDETTGELVETDIQNGSRLQFQELDYAPGLLTRVIKQNGEFRDDMFFAGTYSIDFNACNFYPFKVERIEIKKGNNTHDFKVTPYIRVKDLKIEKAGNLIKATFRLEGSKPEVQLKDVQLYAHTDIYVGEMTTSFDRGDNKTGSFRFPVDDPSTAADESTAVTDIDPTKVYTLTFDLTNEKCTNYFKYTRNYYFRVGAIASLPASAKAGTIRRNYAPHVVINFGL